jgi:AraC-like DNA-binding protein
MKSNIENLTESLNRLDHIHFSVDTDNISPETIHDLSARVHHMTQDPAKAWLFDQDFHPHASITSVADPLKFHVRSFARRF